MDAWNLYYVGSTQGGYYYFDPAAWPPHIYGISPNVGVSGTPGYIPIYGAYLAPQGTTPQVLLDGTTLYIVYQSDNQINVYYDYVSLGTHDLTVTTIYGTSNAVQFTALAGDSTPSITTISPEEWEAGATTDFSIAGTGFGTNPGLTIDGGWIEDYGVYSAWDTGMNAWGRVSSSAPDETVTVSVTSNGYWGNSFMEQYPNQPRSGSANAQVNGAPSGCGDAQKDALIAEYYTYNVTWKPSCSDVTAPWGTTNFPASEINITNDYGGVWTITESDLPTGLENIRAAAGNLPMPVSSGYRNPAHNANMTPPGAPNSWHMYGLAADITETNAARRIAFHDTLGHQYGACVEPLGDTANWVHFDWRPTSARPCPPGW